MRLVGIPVLVAGAALVQAGTGYADRGTTIVLTDPLFTTNSCVPELVTLTGTIRLTVFVGMANGMPDIFIRDRSSHLTGVGAVTGSPYIVDQTDHFNLDTQPSGTTVASTVSHLNVISRGTAPSFRMHTTLHTTINSRGVPTASVSRIVSSCRDKMRATGARLEPVSDQASMDAPIDRVDTATKPGVGPEGSGGGATGAQSIGSGNTPVTAHDTSANPRNSPRKISTSTHRPPAALLRRPSII